MRRALDAGWTALEVHDFLGSVSRTPVPQPLTYLVDDTARTFGTVRVGHAEAFLRADDETALTELLHHPKAGPLGLRRLAPTVLVSTMPARRAAAAAARARRRAGRRGAGRHRAGRPPRPAAGAHPAGRTQPARPHRPRAAPGVSAVVTAIRGRRPGRRQPARRAAGADPPTGSLAALREAVEAGDTVLIGYVDNHGTSSERVVDPVRVEGGWLTAHDHRSDDVRTFAVHRITAVRPVSPAETVDLERGLHPVRRGVGRAAQRRPRRRRRAGGATSPTASGCTPPVTRPATAAAAQVPARAAPGLRGRPSRRPRARRWSRGSTSCWPSTRSRRRSPTTTRRDLHLHVANRVARVAELLIGESLLGLATLVCDLGATGSGVCQRRPVHQRLRRHLAQPVAPLLLRPLLVAGQRRGLPGPAAGRCELTAYACGHALRRLGR